MPGSNACLAVFLTKLCWFVHQLWHVLFGVSFFTDLFSKGLMLTVARKTCDYFNMSVIWIKHNVHIFWPADGLASSLEDTTIWCNLSNPQLLEVLKMLQTLDWKFKMFLIAPSFDTFDIILFNIPGDINYQRIQHWARLMDPLNSLGFKKAWQTNLTRCLMFIPNLLSSDWRLATPACLQGSPEIKSFPGATEHDILNSFLWMGSANESCWQLHL